MKNEGGLTILEIKVDSWDFCKNGEDVQRRTFAK